MKKKAWQYLLIIGVCILSTVLPIFINEAYKLNAGYTTLWSAADALAFYGSYIGAAGTIILGIIAWKQNSRLVKIEEDNFISKNTCIGFVKQITIGDISKKAVNFNLHPEQIVSTHKYIQNINDYTSFKIILDVEMKEGYATLVKIHEMLLVADIDISKPGNGQYPLYCYNINENSFSRTAVYPNGIKFEVTVLVTSDEKEAFLKILQDMYCSLLIDVNFESVSDKYVSSHIKCRTTLMSNSDSPKEKIYNEFILNKDIVGIEPPLCFWYGNKLLDKNDVKVKMEKQ